jgi:hypothetical protein
LTEYYRSQGYEVVSIASKNPFYNFTYDLDPYRFFEGWLNGPFASSLNKTLIKSIYSISPLNIKQYILNRLKANFLRRFDLYISVWNCFMDEETALSVMKNKGGKWITLMVGDDFRNRWVFQTEFGVDDKLLPGVDKNSEEVLLKLKRMRIHERSASLIFSLPDQSSLALRPYRHYQIPINLADITFKIPESKILVVLHCPSHSDSKGSKIIEQILRELKEEGKEILVHSLRNIPHSDLMSILSEADILVDELVFHGPGSLSFEAMASGCAVLTRYYDSSALSFKPPVVSVLPQNLKSILCELIQNRGRIKELAILGRKYVEANNSLSKIADSYLSSLDNPEVYDYIPNYFRNNFDPALYNIDPAEVNVLTKRVDKCDWYREHVPPGERSGLSF